VLTNPRPGCRVQLWYGPRYLPHVRPGLHGACGVLVVVGTGRPRNHGVRLDNGEVVIVPCGNLRLPTTHEQPEQARTNGLDGGDKR
jgi:hypothetical protein